MKATLFYHAKCNDGKHAAYLWWKRYGDAYDYSPVGYSVEERQRINEHEGRRVFVDYCPTQGFRVDDVIIDHHPWMGENLDFVRSQVAVAIWDGNECGASLVAKYLEVKDLFVPFVRDRDLWLNKMESSLALAKFLSLHHDTPFAEYATFKLGPAMTAGEAIIQYEKIAMREVDVLEVETKWGPAKLVNCTQAPMLSDLGGYLGGLVIMYKPIDWFEAQDVEWINNSTPDRCMSSDRTIMPSRWLYSIRDQRDKPMARTVAQALGGGGHEKAAGADGEIWVGDFVTSVCEMKKGWEYA